MLPPDLSVYSPQWIEREIARREDQLEAFTRNQNDSTADQDELEDDLQMLQATLESKEMYSPWQDATFGDSEEWNTGEDAGRALPSTSKSAVGTQLPSDQSWSLHSENAYKPTHLLANPAPHSYNFPARNSPQYDTNALAQHTGPRTQDHWPNLTEESSNRKRGGSLSFPNAGQRVKFMRPSPSPRETSSASPGSDISEYHVQIPEEVLDELRNAMSPEELRELINEQKAVADRAQQERQDERLARTIEHGNDKNPTSARVGTSASNSFGRQADTYQTFLNASGALQRNPSVLSNTQEEPPNSGRSFTAQINASNTQGNLYESSRPILPSFDSSFGNICAPGGLVAQDQHPPSLNNYHQQDLDLSPASSSSDEIREIQAGDFVPSDRSRSLMHSNNLATSTTYMDSRALATMSRQNHTYGSSPITMRPRFDTTIDPASFPAHGNAAGSVYLPASSSGGDLNALSGMLQPLRDFFSHTANQFFGGYEEESGYYSPDENRVYNRSYSYLESSDTRVDSRETAAEIKELVNNIRPDEELEDDEYSRSPEDLAPDCALYEHQKLGVAWMRKMEEGTNKGGILADDMGLGKTVQAIALMTTRRSQDSSVKTTLIVAPVALLRQWESEIKAKIRPARRLSTLIYHGNTKNMTWAHLKGFDVILTTYGTLASEYGRKERAGASRSNDNNDYPPRLALLDPNAVFHRVILDEAQHIRNTNTKNYKAVMELKSNTRFCMTGTPMMNSVKELYALISFLRIRPFSDAKHFREHISGPMQGYSKKLQGNAIRKLHTLLKAILLRRTKKSEINGRPILSLPERTTIVEHAVLEGDQLAFYNALETRTQLRFNRYLKQGTVGAFYGAVLLLLLRLRQACCHPHLIRNFEQESTYLQKSQEDLERIAKELIPADVVRRLLEEDIVDCPICMDAMENSLIFIPCGHRTCSECFSRISEPTDMRDEEGPNTTFRCMSCRGPVDSRKVTDWRAFLSVHQPEIKRETTLLDDQNTILKDIAPLSDPAEHDSQGSSDSESDTDDDGDDDDDDDDDDSLANFVVADDDHGEEIAESSTAAVATGNMDITQARKRVSKTRKKSSKHQEKGKASKKKGKNIKTDKLKHKSLAELQRESRRNIRARHKYFAKLKDDWVSSAKIDKCLAILDEVITQTQDEKIIVFSQFTSFLDLLEVALMDKSWAYKRYDGSMTATARNDAVLEFSNRKSCRAMLVSLKAGNAGLNLTAANHVIILDPFWNPYIEEQAVDRAHRIGQKRPVFVHRILIQNTVEDRIMSIQDRKREVIDSALDENASRSIARLDQRDLAYLFGVN